MSFSQGADHIVVPNDEKEFKLIVADPDTILDSLTREVKEVGPDGQEAIWKAFWGLLLIL
ncbi:hypothetical protein C5167_017257 [Papaver somniferum]|uniref:Uncharacterized protein n=1 Tax=Papaver somniferum TaxID=3469 RepID=A0A4Y7IIW0_PAPSO|nr:hypothetical protein C5167_017257 [Papaver somniferum]